MTLANSLEMQSDTSRTAESGAGGTVALAAGCGCSGNPSPSSDAAAAQQFVYALGQIGWRFPSRSVEKEFAQAIGRTDTAGQTDREALHAALSQRRNRYLVRQLCWVFSIEGLETYLLLPRDISDYELFVDAVRPAPTPLDLDIVIGTRGGIAPAGLCNGLSLPMVTVDQIYVFDRETLFASLPLTDGMDEELFARTSSELLDRILQLADNAGTSDEHRAINYLAVRYPQLYNQTILAHQNNLSLTAVESRQSRLNGMRRIVDVILTYTHRITDVSERYFIRVDVTEQFPFLITKLSPYFDR
ncbi:hypothetical protein NHH73_19030 [Oxalobacteraceae bacterium OTU3CINTB1]|nr:hypothetical protein NHH73_19030 [Oxalobacteraceae bacterium OTU3CINTB1]